MRAAGADAFLDIYRALIDACGGLPFPPAEFNGHYDAIRRDKERFAPFRRLDDDFSALGEDALLARRVAWLKSLPNLRSGTRAEIEAAIERATRDAPLRPARLEALAREQEEARREAAREANRRYFLDAETMAIGRTLLKKLARPFRGDPREPLDFYELIPPRGIAWPVDVGDKDLTVLLIDLETGKALLQFPDNAMLGPIALPPKIADFFAPEVARMVPVDS